MNFKRKEDIIVKLLSSETYRIKFQTLIASFLFFLIGIIMFIVNIINRINNLMIITGIMAFVAFFMIIYILKTNKVGIPKILNLIVFFGSMLNFLYTGGIDGFSPYWILLLPVIAFLLYGFKLGSIISMSMFGIIIFMLWTPFYLQLQYVYSSSFHIRFPLLYFGIFISTFVSEYMRDSSFKKLRSTNATLDFLSYHDSLTNLENRRSFEQHLDELKNTDDYNNSIITILIIDIDNFKNYNDFYGHLKGDTALFETATILKQIVQQHNGYISRWGGEEFICLLPFTDSAQAKIIADELIITVSSAKIIHEKTPLENKVLTISIGGSTTLSTQSSNYDEMIAIADQSLYFAKKNGKNQHGPFMST